MEGEVGGGMRRGEETEGGMCGNNEDNPISEVSVGDDDGIKEYPFITSPPVLKAMEKLRGSGKKELLLDFIKSAPYYDSCPKGSQAGKDAKVAIPIPGPYHSCPILHEAGDDFLQLPIPQRRCPRPRSSIGLASKPKKRSICTKCSQFCFTHMDPELYYQEYLNSCTNARIRNYHQEDGASHAHGALRHSGSCPDSEEKEDAGKVESPSRLTHETHPSGALKVSGGGEGKNSKTIKTKRIKIPAQSRYLPVLRHRLNSTPTSSSPPTPKPPTSSSQDGEDQEPNNSSNPFPMPDVFEEIYFGNMSKGFSFLPSQLQAFKHCQLRVKNGESKVNQTMFALRRKLTSRGLDRLHPGRLRSISNLQMKKAPAPQDSSNKVASRRNSKPGSLKSTTKSQPRILVLSPSVQPVARGTHLQRRGSLRSQPETRMSKTLRKAKSKGKKRRQKRRVVNTPVSSSHPVAVPMKLKKSRNLKSHKKKIYRKRGSTPEEVTKERRATMRTDQEHQLKERQNIPRDMNHGDGFVSDVIPAPSIRVSRMLRK